MFLVEHLLRHRQYLVGCHAVDVPVEALHIALPPIVQETLPETQGKALTGIAGHTNLSFQLPLGG